MHAENTTSRQKAEAVMRSRREFLRSTAAVIGGSMLGRMPFTVGAEEADCEADRMVKALYESLSESQRHLMCFEWDHKGPYGGLPLRLHVTNNWAVSPMAVGALTGDQQALVESVLQSVLEPGWPEKLHQQARDDTGMSWTQDRKIAIFGTPGSGKCQCVISGFHLTFRAGRDRQSGVAFGGAICHGHQPSGFNEKPGHPGNIFWYQARQAHKVYQILDGKQQEKRACRAGDALLRVRRQDRPHPCSAGRNAHSVAGAGRSLPRTEGGRIARPADRRDEQRPERGDAEGPGQPP